MKTLFAIVGLLIFACGLFAAEPPPGAGTNVSPDAKDQMKRLGDRISLMGTIQAGPAHAATEALMGIPENDAHKFHVCLLVSNDPRYKAACDRLEADFVSDQPYGAWVKTGEPAKSWGHWQKRNFEDPLQKHWVDGVKHLLFPVDPQGKPIPLKDSRDNEVPPFPALIIKPPLDGRYGQNDAVVTIIHGYSGNAEEYNERIQKAVDAWIQGYTAGQIQQGPTRLIGAPPQTHPSPFGTPPVAAETFEPTNVSQWPQKRFNALAPLTAKQIKEAIPDAPVAFRHEVLETEPTDVMAVKELWLNHRLKALGDLEKKQEAVAAPAATQTVEECTAEMTHHVDENEAKSEKPNFQQPVVHSSDDEPSHDTGLWLILDLMFAQIAIILLGVVYLVQAQWRGQKPAQSGSWGISRFWKNAGSSTNNTPVGSSGQSAASPAT